MIMENVRNNGQITMNMQNACRNNANCLVILRVFLTEFPGHFSEKRASLAFYVFNPFLHKKLRSFGLYYDFLYMPYITGTKIYRMSSINLHEKISQKYKKVEK